MILTDAIKENTLIAKEYKELLKISYQSFIIMMIENSLD
jgi:hypothetical protein